MASINHVLSEYENKVQYDPIELSYSHVHLAPIMSLMNIMKVNIAHLLYNPRQWHVPDIMQFGDSDSGDKLIQH